MTNNTDQQALRPWLLGLGVALLGMLVSASLVWQQAASSRQIEQARLALAANSLIEALTRRLDAYTEIAFGLRGLFIVAPALGRRAFADAVSHLEVDTRYPEIRNIAFTRYVTAAGKAQFEAQVRADTSIEPQGYPGFAVHPPGARSEYFVADYLWPLAGNQGIQGLDIGTQPANMASMHYSQQTGQPVASAPFNLMQETTERTGFVLRVPVFRSDRNAAPGPAQGNSFLGSVSVTLRVFDLVRQLEREGHLQSLQLVLSDRGPTFGHQAATDIRLPLYASPEVAVNPHPQFSRPLSVYGRQWQLDFAPAQPFLTDSERRLPWLVGLAGSLIALLLGALVTLLARGRFRAVTERDMAESSLRIAAIAFESQEAIVVTDANMVILRVNQAYTSVTGYSAAEAVGKRPRIMRTDRDGKSFEDVMRESILETGSWQGEIVDRRKNGESYTAWLIITAVRAADRRITHYVGVQNDITQRKAAEDEIKYLAFYDPLTRLPNRRLLHDRLRQALAASTRTGRHSALLFIDLDNFKTLNDAQGHDKGDQLLQQVATRLTGCVREGDTVARLGGDEFVVILEDLSTTAQEAATQAETVGEKIIATLNRPYDLDGLEQHSTPSIGVTLFSDQRETIDELLKRADLAMYQAKSAGRNTLRFFDPDMQAVVNARATLEANLREGLRSGQFLVYYQAQVDRGRVTGAEVLLRWQHPEQGFISPASFIPLAEETGLILPLGHWVLATACQQLATWAADPLLAPLTLSVNVSSRQFRQPGFVDEVLATLDAAGADPHKLKLELTESLLLDNVEGTIATMAQLKARGIGFSLDDFGTGYSSLAYLKRLPLEQLKIDQSFVRDVLTDPNDAAIAKTIIALAHSLGLGVMAEGVELAEQRDLLAEAGCHTYQGYFFSRPLPLAGFEAFFRRA